MNVYDTIVRIWAEYDDLREWTRHPNYQDGFVYGTDTKGIVRVHHSKTEEVYEGQERLPRLSSPYEQLYFERNLDKKLHLGKLEKLYNDIPMVNIERCDACDGVGKVDYTFEYDDVFYDERLDCPVCGGYGYVDSSQSRRDFRCAVILKEGCGAFNHKYLYRLIQTMKTLECDTVSLIYAPGDRYAFEFKDGIQVIIMNRITEAEKFVSYGRI